jgi:hypothetical protein
MTARLSMRDTINAKCKECIYDPISRGTWREQVQECTSSQCPLYPLRPLPIGANRRENCVEKRESSTPQQDNDQPSGKDTAA